MPGGFPPVGYTASGSGVTSVTADLPLDSSGGTTPNITLAQDGAMTNEYLRWGGSGWAPASPFLDPPIVDGSTIVPATLNSTTANITGAFAYAAQTTDATPYTISIALPGTTGTVPGSGGTIDVPGAGMLWLDVEIRAAELGAADAAVWKMSIGWAVQTAGSPVSMGALLTSVAAGTNAGAPPAGWSATIALDGTSEYASITFTGAVATTIDISIRGEAGYTE